MEGRVVMYVGIVAIAGGQCLAAVVGSEVCGSVLVLLRRRVGVCVHAEEELGGRLLCRGVGVDGLEYRSSSQAVHERWLGQWYLEEWE